MVRPAEHLSTHSAAVGLHACVQSHVPGKHVTPSKAPLAHITEVGFTGGGRGGKIGGCLYLVFACYMLC